MFTTELIGIYIESDQLQYACLNRTLGSWRARRPVPERAPWDTLKGPGIALLRDFLNSLKPARRRKIFLSLPRGRVFMRPFSLPRMSLEEALEAARNALPVYCHLPLDELYYDIQLSRRDRLQIDGVLYYALRRELDVYINLFRETGHQSALAGIFPFSVGMAAWLACQGYHLPLALLMNQEEWQELAVFQKQGLSFSVHWPIRQFQEEFPRARALADASCSGLDQHFFSLEDSEISNLEAPPANRLERLPAVTDNKAVAALSIPLARQQRISLDGRPVKLKFLPFWKILTPLIIVIIAALSFWTYQAHQALTVRQAQVLQLRAEIQKIQGQVQPLEQQRADILEFQELITDITEFMIERPRLYDAINEISRLVPDETWFSNFGFRDGVITMTGFSSDALKTLEALRSSTIFEDVSLQGTVSRTRAGQEQLSITMTLTPARPETVNINVD